MRGHSSVGEAPAWHAGSAVQIRMAPLFFFSHTLVFKTEFTNNITFARNYPSLLSQFTSKMQLRSFGKLLQMEPLYCVELIRQQIKARNGFGWSIQGIKSKIKY